MSGTLALLTRSLRTDARTMRSHLTRFLLLGLIYLALMYAQSMSFVFGAPGLQFFRSIAWLNLLAITIAGASYFATVITEEKEEETLGLMRMAGIGPLSLLLGKAAPRVIAVMLLLTAQLPFTFLAITLGGVATRQVLAAYILLMAHTLLMAALGLFFSVVCRRSRGASWWTAIVIFAVFLVVPWLSLVLEFSVTRNGLSPWGQQALDVLYAISRASAFWQISAVTSTGFSDSLFGYQVVTNLIAAAVLFALAWALFDVANRGEAASGPGRGLLLRRSGPLQRVAVGRAWSNAFVWKDFHFLAGGRMMLLVKLVLYGVVSIGLGVLGVVLDRSGSIGAEEIGAAILFWVTSALVIELAVVASRVFRDEVAWNTLTSLSILPCSGPYIWYSKLGGHLLGLVPALAWLGVGALLAPESFLGGASFFFAEAFGLLLVLQYLLFLHLTAMLSLLIRWGAMGVAFFAVYVANFMCLGMFFFAFTGDAGLVVVAALGIALVAGLHVGVGLRLRALAAR